MTIHDRPPWLHLSRDVVDALHYSDAVVALETAVVTHGLPAPQNIDAMLAMQRALREGGTVPAVCLIHRGVLHVGAPMELVEEAAADQSRKKASVRDLAAALTSRAPAGLTVSATLHAAYLAGIRVFATGGIGGAHVGSDVSGDVSADLGQLAKSPVITVCAGAKSVLDIPRTLEHLESLGVPVFSYGTNTFPAFYLRSSGCRVPRLDSPSQVAAVARAQWDLKLCGGLLLANGLPDHVAIPEKQWTEWLERAKREARDARVTGQDVTPFLLAHVAEYSNGRTVDVNVALLVRNAELAARVARALRP
ncbi:MAG: pseudouridine-5'-phosphate glycosidase [Chloroflexota bacterium]